VVYPASANGVVSYTGDGNSGVYIYGAQLSDSASLDPYVPTPGAAPSSTAYYGPRFDYDPVTLAPKGILVEEARTNIMLQSQTFDSGTWSKGGATVTANTTVSPDGAVNADALVEDAATSAHFCQQFVSFTTATAYTFSTYVKAGTRAWCLLQFPSSAFGASIGSYFNLSGAGALGAAVGSPTARTITAVGNGWYRVTITATSTATTGGNAPISAASADNTNSYTGVAGAEAIYLYGAQLEAGAFATSYIPTIASTVTRSADVATITGSLFSQWYGQSEGTFVIGCSPIAVDNDIAFSVSNSGGYNNSIYYPADSGAQFIVVNGGAVQANIDAGTVTANITNNIAGAYKASNFAASVGGGAAVATTSGTIPAVDRAVVGGLEVNTANRFNGHIRSINYYPVRAADFQLQALTT
jgi:hypothetical protein